MFRLEPTHWSITSFVSHYLNLMSSMATVIGNAEYDGMCWIIHAHDISSFQYLWLTSIVNKLPEWGYHPWRQPWSSLWPPWWTRSCSRCTEPRYWGRQWLRGYQCWTWSSTCAPPWWVHPELRSRKMTDKNHRDRVGKTYKIQRPSVSSL